MDAVDLSILREICRDKVFWWGGLDPRISTDVIADRLGMAGSTVRARITQWERTGFLRGYDVIPNPSLFGARLAGGSIRVEDARAKDSVLDDLALVPGVKIAMDHVGDWIALIVVSQNARELERTRQLIAKLPHVAEVTPCNVYHGPTSQLVPTSLDLRLVAALRASPRARIQDIATTLRVSARTVTRRYDGLMRANALLFWLLLDFSKFKGVVGRMIVERHEDVTRADVARGVRARFPDVVELWPPHEAVRGYDAFDLFLCRDSLPAIEDAERAIRNVPGVADVETLFPRSIRAYGEWVDSRLAQIVGPQ